jgi:hypothetical protein
VTYLGIVHRSEMTDDGERIAMTDAMQPEAETPSRAEFQFGLQAFLVLFVIVAVFLSYIRTFGAETIPKFGLVATVALLVGGVIGLLAHRFQAAVFWSGIGVVGGYLAVVHSAMPHWSAEYAWPLVGGLVGATAAVCGDGKPWRRMFCSAAVGLAAVSIYSLSFFGFRRDQVADLICAAIGGALAGLAVDLASRFEKRTAVPRHFFALGLVILAIAGHWIAVKLIPGL